MTPEQVLTDLRHAGWVGFADLLAKELERLEGEVRENDRLVEGAWRVRDEETEKAKQAEREYDAAVAECERLQEERDAADSQVIHWKRLHGGVEAERDRLREALKLIAERSFTAALDAREMRDIARDALEGK